MRSLAVTMLVGVLFYFRWMLITFQMCNCHDIKFWAGCLLIRPQKLVEFFVPGRESGTRTLDSYNVITNVLKKKT